MTLTSFGDLAQSHLLRRQTATTKLDLQRLTQEMTTGRAADTAARVSGDLVPISALDSSLARLAGYGSVIRETATFATAMQSGLSVISDLATSVGKGLITATGTNATGQIDSATRTAAQALETVMSALNTRFGDRAIFAGQTTDGPAVISAEALLGTLDIVVAGASSAADVESALDTWFADPAGFAATAYLGASPLAPVPIAAGEVAQIDVTANDPAIRATIKGLAMAALVDRGTFTGQPTLRHSLAQRAGESLAATGTDRAYLTARLGQTEARIDAASTRNTAETSALELARTAIVEVDPYEAATRLQDAESQLDLIYALTARLSRLSLADYI